jgi:hypothetical protein
MQNQEVKFTRQGVRDLGGNNRRPKKPLIAKEDVDCEHPEHQIGKLASGEEYCQLCGHVFGDEG